VTERFILPVGTPLQDKPVITTVVPKAAGWDTEYTLEPEHPFPSVMVTVYVAAANDDRSWFVNPLLHRYVYTPFPPVGVISMLPVDAALHNTFVIFPDEETAAGCETA
jgi:hypothetical protein